jgi:hypothetical protein
MTARRSTADSGKAGRKAGRRELRCPDCESLEISLASDVTYSLGRGRRGYIVRCTDCDRVWLTKNQQAGR